MKIKVVLDDVDVAHALVRYLMRRVSEEYDMGNSMNDTNLEIVSRRDDEWLLKRVKALMELAKTPRTSEIV